MTVSLLIHSIGNQRTLARPAVVEGFGYWGGRDIRVEFRPAAANSGVVFVRTDLEGSPRIEADAMRRVPTPLRTTLRTERCGVDMVEHIMAALGGLEIDNCEVHVNEPEMPGCDGSSQAFVVALDQAGTVALDALPKRCFVQETVRLGTEESWVEAAPSDGNELVLAYHLDYGPDSPIGRQSFELTLSPDAFRKELAPSRTFLLKSEADWLLSQGLGERVTCRDVLVFDERGPVDNELRFADECVRHKMLDMVGDLALAGCRLIGRFTAYRSGHRLNGELVEALLGKSETSSYRKKCA